MNALHERISALCAQRGISIGRLCHDTGISRGNLSDLKMGRIKSLSSEALNKIAAYFGVTVDFLLTGGPLFSPEEALPPAAHAEVGFDDFTYALWQEARELTDEQKKALLGMARFFRAEQERAGHADEERKPD